LHIESLKTLNKKAKMYESNNDDISISRSKALYEVKYEALSRWYAEADKIEEHFINNSKYYCFYFEDNSFHVPIEKSKMKFDTTGFQVLHEFEKSFSFPKNSVSEKFALEYLYKNYNLNPNNYLPYDVPIEYYWPYLPY